MSTDLKRRNIPFSPPDMTEAEANEVRDAILSDGLRPVHARRNWRSWLPVM